MKYLRSALVTLLVAVALVVPAGAVEVHALRLWASPEGTRVVLDLSGSVQHSVLVLKNPDRIVLDVAGARLAPGWRAPAGIGVVKHVRLGRRSSGELRIVLDEWLKAIPEFRVKAGADTTVFPGLLSIRNLPLIWETAGRA